MTVLTPSRPRGPRAGNEPDELRLWPAAPESAPVAPPPPPAASPSTPSASPSAAPAEGETDRGSALEPAVAAPAGPTLEALVTRAWEGLSAHAPVACPVCAGELRPRYGAGTGVVGGRCGGCGSELS